ncbi:MAG TPA: hypothetical protein PLE74_10980 [Candidatus Cloacimonadota bacterium]|nr:hypothetical protein [Candidatus Cloacimonadota bacterium]HPT72792.1 hypothetical protein [Candidatus Cloacimonadota bacterium]
MSNKTDEFSLKLALPADDPISSYSQQSHSVEDQRGHEFEVDKLIYQNINTYRLQGDNLRFQLFLGYLASMAAMIYYLSTINTHNEISIQSSIFGIAVYIISLLYILILAVENWFYILFARFMSECEERLRNGIRLRTLHQYSLAQGNNINPIHPSFNFALVIYCILESYLLFVIFLIFSKKYLIGVSSFIIVLSFVGILAIHFLLLTLLFYHWEPLIYKKLINTDAVFFDK